MTIANAKATLPEIDGDRLSAALERAARIGRWRAPGVQRLALSDADRRMRDAYCAWCRDCGLRVTVDRVGNIFARREGTQELAPVIVGSHLDTQVAGGRYDGALGVLTGLEIVRWLDDQGAVTRRPIEVVSWSNEEGARFRPSMLGSAAFTGALALEDALAATDDEGKTFGSELQRIGYAGSGPVPGAPPAAYFELHIEQGDVLDQRGIDLGLVTSAYPARGMTISLRGQTGHAGATPMRRRRDALTGAAEIIAAIDGLAAAGGEPARATTTRLDTWPNRTGIIPGQATLTVDYRHEKADALEHMARELDQLVKRVCTRRKLDVRYQDPWEFGSGLEFDPQLASVVRGEAARLGVRTIDMPSAAGHDAYWLATIAPTLILFVPCVAGITHNENEQIEFDRVLRGANVLATSVFEVASR